MPLLIIPVLVLIGVAVWVVMQYNFFVSTKARVKAAVQEIGNQLKRQADLIPNLEESAKGYLKHEKGIFKDLAEARKTIASAVKSGDVQKMSDAGSMVSALIPNIQAVFESNPEIKGSEVVGKLMDELRDTADKVMYSRRLVIDLTADYNVRRVSFPSNLVASMFGMGELAGIATPQSGEHVEVGTSDLKTPKVKLE